MEAELLARDLVTPKPRLVPLGSSARAVRYPGQRWLEILWKKRQTRTRRDAALHRNDPLLYRSWVFKPQGAWFSVAASM